jgi:hypothetical protein
VSKDLLMFVAALFCFIFVIFLIISEHTTFDDACRSIGGVASDWVCSKKGKIPKTINGGVGG